jgi:hypothetical protein
MKVPDVAFDLAVRPAIVLLTSAKSFLEIWVGHGSRSRLRFRGTTTISCDEGGILI